MPLAAAVPVTLTASGRKTLKKRVRGAKTPYRDRLRAQVVLAAARGRDNERIAADLRVSVATVRKWRGGGRPRRGGGGGGVPRPGWGGAAREARLARGGVRCGPECARHAATCDPA